jgi:hypothetical protein
MIEFIFWERRLAGWVAEVTLCFTEQLHTRTDRLKLEMIGDI